MDAENETKQNLLAVVIELASLRHALGGLEDVTRRLLEQAERNAAKGGLPPSLIAKAAGVTPGRITQLLARPDVDDLSPAQLSRRAFDLTEWPQDALKDHRKSFAGEMTYPPYPEPRNRRS